MRGRHTIEKNENILLFFFQWLLKRLHKNPLFVHALTNVSQHFFFYFSYGFIVEIDLFDILYVYIRLWNFMNQKIEYKQIRISIEQTWLNVAAGKPNQIHNFCQTFLVQTTCVLCVSQPAYCRTSQPNSNKLQIAIKWFVWFTQNICRK